MKNYTIIDVSNWKRKEHYDFFASLDDPFFSVVSKIEISDALIIYKELGVKFFTYYLYNCTKAANMVEELKFRVLENKIVKYDKIHVSSTIGRDDGTFGFSFVEFDEDINKFEANLNLEIERVKNSNGLAFSKDTGRQDVIHFSPLPWFTFSSLKNPRNFNTEDTVPKFSVGKVFEQNGKNFMNVAADLHHGLADGYHLALFLKVFKNLLNGRS